MTGINSERASGASSPAWTARPIRSRRSRGSAPGWFCSRQTPPRQRGRDPLVAESPELTRVELEHRHLDRHGTGWEVREGVGGKQGWPLYLVRYAEQVAGAS